MTQNFGWHTVFWVVLPIQIGSLVLGWFTIRQISVVVKEKLDWLGWLLLSTFFVAGIFMIERMSTHGLTNIYSLGLFVLMLGSIVSYLLYAKHETAPLLDPRIFKFKTFSLSIAASFVTQAVNLTFNYAIPMALQIVLLKNAQVAGLTLLPGALGYALMAIVSGRLYDRFGAKLPIMIGLSLMLIGTLLMATLPISVGHMTLSFMIVQLGAGFWFGNNMTHAVSHVAVTFQSAGNSIFSATNNYSAAVGIALAAGVLAIFQKDAAGSKSALMTATQQGTSWMFRLDIVLILIAAGLSLWALRVVKKPD